MGYGDAFFRLMLELGGQDVQHVLVCALHRPLLQHCTPLHLGHLLRRAPPICIQGTGTLIDTAAHLGGLLALDLVDQVALILVED